MTVSGKYRVSFNKREEGFVSDEGCILVEEWEVWDADRVVATCGSESDAKKVVAALEVANGSGSPVKDVAAGSLAYIAGYEQGRAQAAKRSVEIVPETPRECFSREAWRALSDVEKVDTLLRRIGATRSLVVVSHALAAMLDGERRSVAESIGSVFCAGCGDIQGIDERGHLDACQCCNDD